jgi:hypothetical protein
MEAISNPNDDESARIVIAVATVTSVATLAVMARLYVRTVMIRSLGWDVSLAEISKFATLLTPYLGYIDDLDNGLLHRRLCTDSRAGQ